MFEPTDDSVKAVDMVRQLRIQEINKLKGSFKMVREAKGRGLRKMATMDASQLAQARAARQTGSPRRGHKRDRSTAGVSSRGDAPSSVGTPADDKAKTPEEEEEGKPNDDSGTPTPVEENKMTLSGEGIKGKIEDGEGESDSDDEDEDTDGASDADKPEDDVDSNNLQYVQNFLLRNRKQSELRVSLTKRLQGYVSIPIPFDSSSFRSR